MNALEATIELGRLKKELRGLEHGKVYFESSNFFWMRHIIDGEIKNFEKEIASLEDKLSKIKI
jgi:hypothetical protein